MQVLLGVLYHFIGGFASGSFYVPYRQVRGWAWESYWIVGGLFSWLIVPPLAAWLTVPGFAAIISGTPGAVLGWTAFMGVLWGIGGLTYGLGIRFLGMSLGNSVILGYCSAFGALVPSIYYYFAPAPGKVSIADLAASSGGQLVLLGVFICLAGIALSGIAGWMKERELPKDQQQDSIREFDLGKGLLVATLSGILSACFNFGIEAGKPMAEAAVAQGFNPLFQNNVTYVVLLWGGLATNFVWCMLLNYGNGTFGDYVSRSAPILRNVLFSALAGTTWFLQFFFYGMGESKLGNGASSWILHMAFIILVANGWGIALREWRSVSRKTLTVSILGILTILASVVIVGLGNAAM
ncbi:MAG: L-rhamnose/proton symporter RhaT [Bacteroidia bacterium]|nr:L-rhamnose/proton symporter RhaT [Bacteroidia bacterium]